MRATGRMRSDVARVAVVVAVALIGVLAGCGDDDGSGATSAGQTTAAAPATAPTTEASPGTGATTTPAAPAAGAVTRDEAGAIAVARVGGVVDTIEPETDYGARWEVDVYTADEEYTVYVSAAGAVVRVDGPFPRD